MIKKKNEDQEKALLKDRMIQTIQMKMELKETREMEWEVWTWMEIEGGQESRQTKCTNSERSIEGIEWDEAS